MFNQFFRGNIVSTSEKLLRQYKSTLDLLHFVAIDISLICPRYRTKSRLSNVMEVWAKSSLAIKSSKTSSKKKCFPD